MGGRFQPKSINAAQVIFLCPETIFSAAPEAEFETNTALDSYISLDSKVQTRMHEVHKRHRFLLRVQHLAKFPRDKHTVRRMASDTIMCCLMKTTQVV